MAGCKAGAGCRQIVHPSAQSGEARAGAGSNLWALVLEAARRDRMVSALGCAGNCCSEKGSTERPGLSVGGSQADTSRHAAAAGAGAEANTSTVPRRAVPAAAEVTTTCAAHARTQGGGRIDASQEGGRTDQQKGDSGIGAAAAGIGGGGGGGAPRPAVAAVRTAHWPSGRLSTAASPSGPICRGAVNLGEKREERRERRVERGDLGVSSRN